ncbi:MAG: hypothetical protein ACLT1C_05450 [Weissella confusa]
MAYHKLSLGLHLRLEDSEIDGVLAYSGTVKPAAGVVRWVKAVAAGAASLQPWLLARLPNVSINNTAEVS